jgi:glycosyltransferase involved in cell wall biosynthesis
MDPSVAEVEMVREEQMRWPGWETEILEVPEEYSQRRRQEWALANRVVVNSEFCRRALLEQGVPAEKLAVVPLCFEEGAGSKEQGARSEKQRAHSSERGAPSLSAFLSPLPAPRSPLRVLFLGQVILRKGIQYLIEAARKLTDENVRFDIFGPIGISRDAVASAPANVTFHGRVPRAQASDWYRQSDVFVLPTISDGFALTQLEAMAHGVPVIATPNCGEVVTDGVDGFIIPPRDSAALAQVIAKLSADRALLKNMSANTLQKVRLFSLERLYENLRQVVAGSGERGAGS